MANYIWVFFADFWETVVNGECLRRYIMRRFVGGSRKKRGPIFGAPWFGLSVGFELNFKSDFSFVRCLIPVEIEVEGFGCRIVPVIHACSVGKGGIT